MTAHEREAIQDRCARCDGTPDAQRLLAEMRAQVEQARRERDEALERARISDRCRLANEAEMRRADEQIGHLRAALKEAASYANAIGLIESALGIAGSGLLCETVRAVDAVVKQLADARASAEQGVRVARDLEERLRAERAAGMELRASLVEAATFARGVVGQCDCLTCSPSQQLAERWERQARTEASRG